MRTVSALTLQLCCLLLFVSSAALAAPIAGDIDMSGTLDAVDIQMLVNCALGTTVCELADVNYDGTLNAVDIQIAINGVLGINIDADGDGLCDVGEANLGTDPNDTDTDNDQWPDWDEVHLGGDPLDYLVCPGELCGKIVNFRDYWPFAVGNGWDSTLVMDGGFGLHITGWFTVNGFDVWECAHWIGSIAGGEERTFYYVYVNDALHATETRSDLDALPEITGELHLQVPEVIEIGVPVDIPMTMPGLGGGTFRLFPLLYGPVIPRRGGLGSVLEDTGLTVDDFPLGDHPDVLAFVTEDGSTIIVFGRDVGPMLLGDFITQADVAGGETVNFADYWPFAVGNRWESEVIIDGGFGLTITDQFSVNGFEIWECTYWIGSIAGREERIFYYVYVNEALYATDTLSDLDSLPEVSGDLHPLVPEVVQIGVPTDVSISVSPLLSSVQARMMPIQSTLSSVLKGTRFTVDDFPLGYQEDVLAFLTEDGSDMIVFARDLGPMLLFEFIADVAIPGGQVEATGMLSVVDPSDCAIPEGCGPKYKLRDETFSTWTPLLGEIDDDHSQLLVTVYGTWVPLPPEERHQMGYDGLEEAILVEDHVVHSSIKYHDFLVAQARAYAEENRLVGQPRSIGRSQSDGRTLRQSSEVVMRSENRSSACYADPSNRYYGHR